MPVMISKDTVLKLAPEFDAAVVELTAKAQELLLNDANSLSSEESEHIAAYNAGHDGLRQYKLKEILKSRAVKKERELEKTRTTKEELKHKEKNEAQEVEPPKKKSRKR